MPIYEYKAAAASECTHCRDGFETLQKLADDALQQCPMCCGPVRRVISAPNVGQSDSDLSPKNVEKHGFTQYRKVGKGQYEKTAGKGPRTLSDDGK